MQIYTLLATLAPVAPSQGPDLTRYFAVLGGVALVLILLAVGLRRLVSSNRFSLRSSRRSLQVVEMLPLGARRHLAVVRCYDRTFALGLGEKSVSLVAELDAEFVQHKTAEANAEQNAEQQSARSVAQNDFLTPQEAPAPPAARAATTGDPFEALLNQAQAQLDARRKALAKSKGTRPANDGLEELC